MEIEITTNEAWNKATIEFSGDEGAFSEDMKSQHEKDTIVKSLRRSADWLEAIELP